MLSFDHQDDNVTLDHDPEHSKKLNEYLQTLNEQVKRTIALNQQRYKQRYDTNRSNSSFRINDLVLVKTLNYRHKFDVRYEGPYKITQQLSPKTFIVQHIKKPTLSQQVTSDVLLPIVQRIN